MMPRGHLWPPPAKIGNLVIFLRRRVNLIPYRRLWGPFWWYDRNWKSPDDH